MIIPACDEILSLSGEYDIIPICREIYADVVTPITLLRRIAERSSRFYLLESIEAVSYTHLKGTQKSQPRGNH